MPITVPCLKCKAKFTVPSKLAGTAVRCQNCGFMLKLPSPEIIQAKKQSPGGPAKTNPKPTKSTDDAVQGPGLLEEPFEFFDAPSDGKPENAKARDGKAGPAKDAAAAIPEPTVLSCSHCEGLLYYDPNFANQTVACPHCGNHLVMPEL